MDDRIGVFAFLVGDDRGQRVVIAVVVVAGDGKVDLVGFGARGAAVVALAEGLARLIVDEVAVGLLAHGDHRRKLVGDEGRIAVTDREIGQRGVDVDFVDRRHGWGFPFLQGWDDEGWSEWGAERLPAVNRKRLRGPLVQRDEDLEHVAVGRGSGLGKAQATNFGARRLADGLDLAAGAGHVDRHADGDRPGGDDLGDARLADGDVGALERLAVDRHAQNAAGIGRRGQLGIACLGALHGHQVSSDTAGLVGGIRFVQDVADHGSPPWGSKDGGMGRKGLF